MCEIKNIVYKYLSAYRNINSNKQNICKVKKYEYTAEKYSYNTRRSALIRLGALLSRICTCFTAFVNATLNLHYKK